VTAYGVTLPPSTWCMICTSLVCDLLLVEANHCVNWAKRNDRHDRRVLLRVHDVPFFFALGSAAAESRDQFPASLALRGATVRPAGDAVVCRDHQLVLCLRQLNTDPSLLDYFKPHTPLRDGLEYVDRNGAAAR